VPPEYFDVIVVDECHRSIYTVWRQVLEYFDAYLIGLTATPYKQTFGGLRDGVFCVMLRVQGRRALNINGHAPLLTGVAGHRKDSSSDAPLFYLRAS
jgi:hypothetical protein